MKKEVCSLKKLAVIVLVSGLTLAAHAGSWLVYVKMHDDTIVTLEMASVPNPDSAGMYRLHTKDRGEIVVHASNVWIVEKSNARAKAKNRK